jgi:hypothetical protein
MPLALAVSVVRSKFASDSSSATWHPNGIATFIAAVLPIWEYSDDSSQQPRTLLHVVRDATFQEGGRELRFLDGRPSKFHLAVQADDICRVIDMLQHPDRAVRIRTQVLRALADGVLRQSLQSNKQWEAPAARSEASCGRPLGGLRREYRPHYRFDR